MNPPTTTGQKASFQARAYDWLVACFGKTSAADKKERVHRFVEESLELAQSLGCSKEDALMLVDYVFSRPVGEPQQEVGGTMTTLAVMCALHDLDMADAAETELARISTAEMIAKIRAKRATKPEGSPLPQPADAA